MHPNFIIGPRLCACGCNNAIVPQRYHRFYGTPLYLPGHNNNWGDKRRETRICTNCGQSWEGTKGHHPEAKYCSRQCYEQVIASNATTTCIVCGIQKVRPACQERYRYCSRACYAEHMRQGYRAGRDHPLYGRRGELAPNWRGGVTPENQRLRQSLEYREWREAVFRRDAYTCQRCGDNRGGNLRGHHIQGWADHPALRFDVENGITLCESCHIAVHRGIPLSADEGQTA